MAETLHLRILTPQQELLDETVALVTAEGALGQFGVLPKHITFLTSLDPGVLSFRRLGAGEERIAIRGGYAEVREDVVTVLADQAVRAEDLRPVEAQTAVDKAAAALEATPYGHADHESARRELRWAQVCAALAGAA